MPAESPCNAEELDLRFVDATQYINPVIADRSKKYLNIWRSLIDRGTFPYGQGYILQNETFYGGTAVQDAGASWVALETSRPPNPETGDPGFDACRYESEVINYGFETKEFQMFQATRRTLDICLTDILFRWQFEKQLALIFGSLANVTLGEWEQYLREQYIFFSTKFIALNSTDNLGLEEFTLPLFGSEIAVPTGGFERIGRLTQEVLDRLYQFVFRQAPDASMGVKNGMPQYGLVTSTETSKEIIRDDPERRTDFREGDPSFLIEGYGTVTNYQGYAHIHDPHAPRFVVNSTGTQLVRVFPFEKTPTTIGEQVNISQDYIKAPFELSVILLKDVYKALIPPPNPSKLAGAYEFDPQDNFGDFDWLNIQDRCENPLREKGFFFARFRAAAEPLQYSKDAISILHRRCQELPLTVCAPCDTEVATAITIVSCAQHTAGDAEDDATEFDLVLASCPACGVGQEVTVTFVGSQTLTAIITEEGNAPTITVAFAAGQSGGICSFDSGMATLICS